MFECKKVLKKKSIWMAAALSMLAIVGLSYIHFTAVDSVRAGNIAKQENLLSQFQMYLESAEIEKATAEKRADEATVDAMAAAIDSYKQSIKNIENWIDDYRNGKTHTMLAGDISDLELYLTDTASVGIEEQLVQSFTLRASLEEKRWLEKKGIDPVVQNTIYLSYIPTIYDQFTGRAQDAWEQMTARYGDTGLSYLYSMIPSFLVPILILIGCFLFGNGVSAESGKKKRGMQLQFVQPVRKTTLFLSKYFSGLLATILFISVLLGILILSGEFGNGIGSTEYPVLVYEGGKPNPYGSEFNTLDSENDQFHFIPIATYVKNVTVLGLGLLFFTYSLYFLLALFIRNQSATVLVTGAIVFGGMKVLPLSAYNPFIYVDIHRVLNGELATIAFNPAVGFQNGMVALLAASMVLLVVAYVGFHWKSKNIAM